MNKKYETITVRDVAKRAGVSVATVSRVLSNSNYPVSENSRDKVIDAAHSLGYLPKHVLQPTEKDVVVILPSLSNPYYISLLAGLEISLRIFGFNVLIVNTRHDAQLERELVQELSGRRHLKVIIAPVTDCLDHLDKLVATKAPVIVLEQPYFHGGATIAADYRASGAIAAEHLLTCKKQRIAFFSAPLSRYSRREVFEGFRDALAMRGIHLKEEMTFIASEEPALSNTTSPYYMGISLAKQMLQNCDCLPDAIFCGNDMMAIGVLRALSEKGIMVPRDISLIGLDNIDTAEVSNPPLTTIDECTYEIGSMAAEMLCGMTKDPERKAVHVSLQPKLVMRESVSRTSG